MNKTHTTQPHRLIARKEFWVLTLFGVLLLLIGLYVYFLSASIVHVVMQKESAREIVTMRTKISELESTYIAAQHAISAELANLDGYARNEHKIFIHRTSDSLVLSD